MNPHKFPFGGMTPDEHKAEIPVIRCYRCHHSPTWTWQEHQEGVRKLCMKKGLKVHPNDTCDDALNWIVGAFHGVLKGYSAGGRS